MTLDEGERLARRFRLCVDACVLGVALLGLAVLAGWAADVEGLKSVLPGLATMKVNTALSLVLCAIALGIAHRGAATRAGRIICWSAATGAGLIAAATLFEHITGWDLGIDQCLFIDPVRSAASPVLGRPAVDTCVALLLIAAAVLALDWPTRAHWHPTEPLAMVVGFLGLLRLAGNLFEGTGLPRMVLHGQMAVHTAAALAALAGGVLLARPERRLMSVVASPTPAGTMTRRLMLAVLVVPIAFDYLRLLGEVAGLYGVALSVSIRTVGTTAVLLTLTWFASLLLQKSEQERTAASLAARRQETILASVLRSMSDGVVVADTTGAFLVFNAAAEQILGVGAVAAPPEEWTARYGVFHADGMTPVPTPELPLVRAMRGETTDDAELFIRNPKLAEGRYISVNARPLRGEGVTGGVAVFRDVTAVRRVRDQIQSMNRVLEEQVARRTRELRSANRDLAHTNEELRRKNAELDEFTFVASHDLQEPLRKLIAFSSLLARDVGGDLTPDAAKDLNFIIEAATRMQRLVQDLLLLSRAGRSTSKREPVELEGCCDAALDALAARVAETGATITRDALPVVLGDGTLLTQLYQNLIGNALKFHGQAAPRIHVLAEQTPAGWLLGVRDNGIGVPPQYAEQIFSPFKRLHGRDAYEGTGIGLSICRRAVDRHGGRIWCEPAPGGGAQFLFTLPNDRTGAVEPVEAAAPAAG